MIITIQPVNTEAEALRLAAMGPKLDGAIEGWMAVQSPKWEAFTRAMVMHVVYTVYDPTHYTRNFNLVHAVDRQTERASTPIGSAITTHIFNNSEKITYQPRADGSIGPRGGAQPWEVPWQIEEGEFPEPWYGYSHPRPAYLMAMDAQEPAITFGISRLVDSVVAG